VGKELKNEVLLRRASKVRGGSGQVGKELENEVLRRARGGPLNG